MCHAIRQALALDPARVTFRNGTLEVTWAEAVQPVAEVEEFSAHVSERAPATTPRLDEQRLQILFTVLTALFTLAALLFQRWGAFPLIVHGLFALAYFTGGWFGLLASLEAYERKPSMWIY